MVHSRTRPSPSTYTDGTTARFTQSISDWAIPQGFAGETTALTTAYRDTCQRGLTGRAVPRLRVHVRRWTPPRRSRASPCPWTRTSRCSPPRSSPRARRKLTSPPPSTERGSRPTGTPFGGGGLDGYGYAFSSSLLGTSLTAGGAIFGFGPAGAPRRRQRRRPDHHPADGQRRGAEAAGDRCQWCTAEPDLHRHRTPAARLRAFSTQSISTTRRGAYYPSLGTRETDGPVGLPAIAPPLSGSFSIGRPVGQRQRFTSGNPNDPQGPDRLPPKNGIDQPDGEFRGGRSYAISGSAPSGATSAPATSVQVLADGPAVDTITPSGTSYATYTTATFNVTAGNHTIAFVGVDPSGSDYTALVDQAIMQFVG